jgi:hypothetical protein
MEVIRRQKIVEDLKAIYEAIDDYQIRQIN